MNPKLTLNDCEIDNRDITTTELHFKDFTLEVTRNELLDLVTNMDENNPDDELVTSSVTEILQQSLMKHGDQFWNDTDDNKDNNLCLVEDVIEAARKEGYEIKLVKTYVK